MKKPKTVWMAAYTDYSESWDILEAKSEAEALLEANAGGYSYITKGNRIQLPDFDYVFDAADFIDSMELAMAENNKGRFDSPNFSLPMELQNKLEEKLNKTWLEFFKENPKAFDDNYFLTDSNENVIQVETEITEEEIQGT